MQTNTNPDGPSRWMRRAWLLPMIVALVGCGGGGPSDPTQGPAQDPQQAEPIPEELRGRWDSIHTYVPPDFISQYGIVAGNDGSLGIAFYFHADGRYEHKWDLLKIYYGGNCIRTGEWQENGTLTSAGAEFTFNPGRATYMQTDTCGQFKYLDPAPAVPANHTLTLDRDATGWPLLRMGYPTGELVLEKCRRCQ